MTCSSSGCAQASCRGFCDIPPATLLGWPKNIGHATSPHQAMVAYFAQLAAQAISVSATGDELLEDLVVTEGHKHNAEGLLIEWRQLGAWPISGRTLAGAATVGQVINEFAATEDVGLYLFRLPLDSAGVRVRSYFYPKFRATVPSPGAPADSTLIVSGDLVRVAAGGVLTVVQALPPLNLVAQAGPPAVSFVSQWFSWGPVEVPASVTDARFGLRLRAKVALIGQQGTVLESMVSLLGGL